MTSHNVGGLLVLNKMSEVKQIIIDFQSYHMEELFVKRHDNSVHILEHIENKDPRNNFTFSFEIENALKKRPHDFSSYFLPDIYQWIKCVIFSIYREVQNHIIFTSSGKVFTISMKKEYYNTLLRKKYIEKIKIRDMYHTLFREYIEYYKQDKKVHKAITSIPNNIRELFVINEIESDTTTFNYYSHNPLMVISKT